MFFHFLFIYLFIHLKSTKASRLITIKLKININKHTMMPYNVLLSSTAYTPRIIGYKHERQQFTFAMNKRSKNSSSYSSPHSGYLFKYR